MYEICKLGNLKIQYLHYLFCIECNKILNNNGKIYQGLDPKSILCEDCYNKNEKKHSQNYHIVKQEYYINGMSNIDELLFFCSKYIKCKEKYTLEDMKNNHSHLNSTKIKCNSCKIDLSNSSNCLSCVKCKNFFCFKNLNYNAFLCKIIKTSNQNCGLKCYKCFNPVCALCNKNKYKYIICQECQYTCENCNKNNSETICKICNKMLCSACIKKCKKCLSILCPNDFKNKNECLKHDIQLFENKNGETNKNNFLNICSICNNKIYSVDHVNKCKISSCKKLICINCTLFCNICKNLICKNCSIHCSNCSKENSLISCINCKSDTIFKCSMKNCSIKLCLKCVRFCNYCEEINCLSHSLSCVNCSEVICKFHWHICKRCSTKKEEKLCLKNCTYKCYNCSNEVNSLCKEENHINDFCKKYPCGCIICNTCSKKCDDCKKVIQECPENKVEQKYVCCRLCKKNICFDCAIFCYNCNEYHCNENHNCNICGKIIKNDICPNCDFIKRTKCIICSNGLKQCEFCFKKIICSSKCYLERMNMIHKKSKNKKFIRSYTIQSNKSTSYKSNVTNNMLNSVINLFQANKEKEKEKNSFLLNNNTKNKVDLSQEKEDHLCCMYWCAEHLGMNSNEPIMIRSNNLNDLIPRVSSINNNNNNFKRLSTQANTKCSSCLII